VIGAMGRHQQIQTRCWVIDAQVMTYFVRQRFVGLITDIVLKDAITASRAGFRGIIDIGSLVLFVLPDKEHIEVRRIVAFRHHNVPFVLFGVHTPEMFGVANHGAQILVDLHVASVLLDNFDIGLLEQNIVGVPDPGINVANATCGFMSGFILDEIESDSKGFLFFTATSRLARICAPFLTSMKVTPFILPRIISSRPP